MGVHTPGRHPNAGSRWDAFQGADHHPIDDETFYRIIGRDNLVRAERQRTAVKLTLTIRGWTLIGGGSRLSIIGGFAGDAQIRRPDSMQPSSFPVLSVAGLAAIAAGIASSSSPTRSRRSPSTRARPIRWPAITNVSSATTSAPPRRPGESDAPQPSAQLARNN